MIYNDRVYGKSIIKEKILIDIIKSPELQRLKGIQQFGRPNSRKSIFEHSRFSHSLGVSLLLCKYGADMNEQIAGLIHDVSHSAFSHNIDYVLKGASGKTQSYQDNIFADYVKKSSLPKIFTKYKKSLEYILNEDNFPLLETKLPELCADRIDYCLRDAKHSREINQANVDFFLNNLTIKNKKWVFKNTNSAQKFSDLFLKMNRIHWSALYSAKIFKAVGDYLRYALMNGYIDTKDLFLTDKQLVIKVNEHSKKDNILRILFKRTLGKVKYRTGIKDIKYQIYCKSRIVDPWIIAGKELKKLSLINKSWKKVVAAEIKPKKYYIKFLP